MSQNPPVLRRAVHTRTATVLVALCATVLVLLSGSSARAATVWPRYGILWHDVVHGEFGVWEVNLDGTVYGAYYLTAPGSPYNGGYFYCGEYPYDPTGCSHIFRWNLTELFPQIQGGFDFVSYDPVGGAFSVQLTSAAGSVTTPGYVLDSFCGIGCADVWKVVGTGSFDDSGQPSLLWYDAADGLLGAWQVSPFDLRTVLAYPTWPACGGGSCATYGSPVSAADFNGDGITDVLWMSSAGMLTIFLEDGHYGQRPFTLSRRAPNGSTLVGARALSYGWAVLVWYNQFTGIVQSWMVDGSGTVASSRNLSWTCDGCRSEWEPVGLIPVD